MGVGRDSENPGGRRRSNNSLVRAQSQSMVRGEHPFMAFMLPSVSLSEAGSETDSLSGRVEHCSGQRSSPRFRCC